MTGADVFVFPSLTDTFGLVLLEALACGTPVAAFPVTGPLDIFAGTGGSIGAIDADLRAAACARCTLTAPPAAPTPNVFPGAPVRRPFAHLVPLGV